MARQKKPVHRRGEGADIFLDYLSDQSKSMSVLNILVRRSRHSGVA